MTSLPHTGHGKEAPSVPINLIPHEVQTFIFSMRIGLWALILF